MNLSALASLMTSFISSSVASDFPYNKFSLIVPRINTGSYPTQPILSLRASKLKDLIALYP